MEASLDDSPWQYIGSTSDPEATWLAASQAIALAAPGHDLGQARRVLDFLMALFRGQIHGYQPLQTPYHNTTHTMEVFLCASHLLHGLKRAGRNVDSAMIDAVLIGALLHDTGYVLADDEGGGSGAQFTQVHEDRGVVVARRHFGDLAPELLNTVCAAIETTNHRRDLASMHYDSPAQKLAAMVLGTADIVGQMASREYLERLMFLYFEFKEAGIGDFADLHDLLEHTIDFYQWSRERLYEQFGGLAEHLALHFLEATGVGRNYYLESIERNIAYLGEILSRDRSERLDFLKRGGIVDRFRSAA